MIVIWMMSLGLTLSTTGQVAADDGALNDTTAVRQLNRAEAVEPRAQTSATLTRGGWQAMWALGAVLFVIVLVAWAARRYLPLTRLGGGAALQVISRTHLSSKQSLALVRAGNRLVMLGVTPENITTLASFDDPEEMAGLMTAATGTARGFDALLGHETRRFEQVPEGSDLETSRQNVSKLISRIRGMAAAQK